MGFFSRLFQPKQKKTGDKPRSCLPDAVGQDAFVLIKTCSLLRLTYEIRVATFMARGSCKRLRVMVQASTVISPDLRAFATQQGVILEQKA